MWGKDLGGPKRPQPHNVMTIELIVEKMKSFITVSRGYLNFLRNEEANDNNQQQRGVARAFMFDALFKALMLIVDEVILQFEKASNIKVQNASNRVNVSFFKSNLLFSKSMYKPFKI